MTAAAGVEACLFPAKIVAIESSFQNPVARLDDPHNHANDVGFDRTIRASNQLT